MTGLPFNPRTAVEMRDLTVGYGSHAAVHHLSCCFSAGSLSALVGVNGSGKSTLIKTIAGLLRPMSGRCHIAPGTSLAYLPQQSELDRSFPARVRDLVSLGLWSQRGLLGRHRAQDRDRVAAAISAVGLDGFDTRPIDSLSGGQLQRALFARVLVQDAQLILLDEPFNAVDERTIGDLVALIHRWQGQGRTVIVVAHDLDLVRAQFPQTLLLARRPIAWGATLDVLTSDNLQRARNLHEAWDDHAPWCAPDEVA
ncbi:zinc ABC transporter ATP-binding protein AztA [Paracoccus laeviglucosivorans]|uniref:Zinc/manganese transport system ATP-binding protein n=1 Tax=Paracoccus laeviglucosivorans TaxID=1197861 RepID=A0A521FRJ6_9RHOB|nr:zinc ABC transporter ATP-binding protein AztA [Paracoccus laeviglucosivorans]SMO98843.1 zinc/manganese transport system ATP-binding protein [Paracoccus laeviglucosivorans]